MTKQEKIILENKIDHTEAILSIFEKFNMIITSLNEGQDYNANFIGCYTE